MARAAKGAFRSKGAMYRTFGGPIARQRSTGVARIVRDNYGPDWNELRKQAIRRDENRCVLCPKDRPRVEYDLDVHHIVPISKGGRTTLSNLMCLCEDIHHPARHKHLLKRK